jgi:hypothetical protein
MRRPLAVTMIATFFFAATLLLWILSVVLLTRGFRQVVVILLGLSFGPAIAAVGLWWGRLWSRWFAVVLVLVLGVWYLSQVIFAQDWMRTGIAAAIAAAILAALWHPRVRGFCRLL